MFLSVNFLSTNQVIVSVLTMVTFGGQLYSLITEKAASSLLSTLLTLALAKRHFLDLDKENKRLKFPPKMLRIPLNTL